MPRVKRDGRESPGEWVTRAVLAEDLAECALEVADGPVRLVNGKMDMAAVQRKRLQVETLKWLAAKLHPEVYGDRVSAEVSGPAGEPLGVAVAPTPVDWITGMSEPARGSAEGSEEEEALDVPHGLEEDR